jgi:hypothetical protein
MDDPHLLKRSSDRTVRSPVKKKEKQNHAYVNGSSCDKSASHNHVHLGDCISGGVRMQFPLSRRLFEYGPKEMRQLMDPNDWWPSEVITTGLMIAYHTVSTGGDSKTKCWVCPHLIVLHDSKAKNFQPTSDDFVCGS